MGLFDGLRVQVSDKAVTRRWVFPADRFVTYEAKDEKWCRYFGIGHEVCEPGAFMIRDPFGPVWGVRSDMCDTLVVHPAVWAAMQKEFG